MPPHPTATRVPQTNRHQSCFKLLILIKRRNERRPLKNQRVGADFSETKTTRSDFSGAEVKTACFLNADLRDAELNGLDFSGADLSGANLSGTDLNAAGLVESNLRGAFLHRANLSKADLRGANLEKANLSEADLRKAILTGCCLYETVRAGWVIDGVLCDFVFWTAESRKKMPNGRMFRGGEFETLYRQLPTIRFDLGRNGAAPIAAVIMDHVVKTINLRHPQLQLKMTGLDLQNRPSALFSVPNARDGETALTLIGS